MRSLAALVLAIVFASAAGGCSDDSTATAADAGAADGAPTSDGATSDAPYRRVEEGPRTPICEGHDPTSTTPYFELQIDGVTKTAGETKVLLDNNGNVQITVGYPTIAQGSSGSQVFYVRFPPNAVSGACDSSAPGRPLTAGYSYSVPNGPVTGANSTSGPGPCAMTLAFDGGVVRGEASGKLSNVTAKYEQTFDFEACWTQPMP